MFRYLTILQWFLVIPLASNYEFTKYLARLQLDFDGKIIERSAIIIQSNIIIANSPEFEDFGDSTYVRYDLRADLDKNKRVQVDKFIKFDKNPLESQHPFVLVTTRQNMRMDPRAAASIPITSKEASATEGCVVIVADRPHRIQIMDMETCMDLLPDLQEGYICLSYSEAAYKGFALLCDNELSGIILPRSTWLPNEPVLYTDLYKRRDWILEQMLGHRPPIKNDNEVSPAMKTADSSVGEGAEERDADANFQKSAEIISSKHGKKRNSCVKSQPRVIEKNHYRMNKTNSAHNKRDFLHQELNFYYTQPKVKHTFLVVVIKGTSFVKVTCCY
uniref:Peptidase S1 domain-containing protein n=1 Tax=Glossina palpalis gambiensis TaxID=67801 RepID=A0A1B0B1H5_9MUSC